MLYSEITMHGLIWLFFDEFENLSVTAQEAIRNRIRKRVHVQMNIESLYTVPLETWRYIFKKVKMYRRREMRLLSKVMQDEAQQKTSVDGGGASDGGGDASDGDGEASDGRGDASDGDGGASHGGGGASHGGGGASHGLRPRTFTRNNWIETLIEFAQSRPQLVHHVPQLRNSAEAQEIVSEIMMSEDSQGADTENEASDIDEDDDQKIQINSKDPEYRCVGACKNILMLSLLLVQSKEMIRD